MSIRCFKDVLFQVICLARATSVAVTTSEVVEIEVGSSSTPGNGLSGRKFSPLVANRNSGVWLNIVVALTI